MAKVLKVVGGASAGVLLIILAVLAIFYFTDIPEQASVGACSGGTTILSISQAHVTTSTDLSGKEVIRVLATANGGGECARIRWRASDLEQVLSNSGENYEVDNDVFGDLVIEDQTQTFTVNKRDDQNIHKVAQRQCNIGIWNEWSCSPKNCANDGSVGEQDYIYTYWGGVPKLSGCYGVYRVYDGKGGQFASSFEKDFKVKFSIEDLGEAYITKSQQSAKIGNKAFIKWAGDLFAGSWLSKPDYDAYLKADTGSWQMADDGFFDDVQDRWERDNRDRSQDIDTGCLQGGLLDVPSKFWDLPKDRMNYCIENYNNFVTQRTAERLSNYKNEESLVRTAMFDGNELIVDLDAYTTWQVFTIDLDAQMVGIHKNTGQPEVECPSGKPEISSGTQVSSQFKVKDQSGTRPSFGLSLSCISGIGSLQQSRITNVGSSYQEVTGYVSITTQQDIDFTCTFEAYDLNDPDSRDSCTANFKGVKFKECTKNVCSSDFTKIGQCKSDGTLDYEPCEFGCDYDKDGVGHCLDERKEICNDGEDNDNDNLVDKDDPDCQDTCAWYDIPCRIAKYLEQLRLVIAIIGGFIASLLGGFGFQKIKREQKLKAPKYTSLIIGLILGLAIGYVLYVYFYLGLGILVALVIIKLILGRFGL